MEKLIKNVDQKTWSELKLEAAKHGLRLSDFLKYLIKEHKRINEKKNSAWDYIKNAKRRLSDKEADEILASIERVFETEEDFEG